jgi:UDP-glucose 4-epimerase
MSSFIWRPRWGSQLIVRDPIHTIETNVLGTGIVLRIANRYRRKVILASTSEVYGKSTDVPFREDGDRVMGPTTRSRWSLRQCSKAMDEFLALAYHKQRGLPIVICPLLQHHRAAADGALRHGRAAFRAPGARAASRSLSTATASRRVASPTCWT